jgi:hypothetical protein
MRLFTIILLLSLTGTLYAQSPGASGGAFDGKAFSAESFKDSLLKYDLGPLWTLQDNTNVLGYIGDGYQRIRVKILSAEKDKDNPGSYIVTGKTMVMNNITMFKGTIELTDAKLYQQVHSGTDNQRKHKGLRKRGVLTARYHFREDSTQYHSGIFNGILTTAWYIDKDGNIRYDDIDRDSDSYANNQFEGMWTIYSGKLKQVCNWGDFRIPSSGGLDVGKGNFLPADKYLRRGWRSYYNAHVKNDPKAQKEEARKWWE